MRRIRRITLRDFRSYDALDLPLSGRSVALTGPNGAGKTNLLEALSIMGPGRGLRRATFSDLARQGGSGGWGVGITLGDARGDAAVLSARADPGPSLRRDVRIDGETASSANVLLDYLHFTWLTPAQDRLFVEGASERRRFLDRMVLARHKAHGTISATYEKAMRQRQAALAEGRTDPRLLSVLERQMAEAGVAIAAARRETVASLARGYAGIRQGAFPEATLALDGAVEEALAAGNATDTEEWMAERLAAARPRDREAGRALFGPHRADLLVTHRGKDQPARLCSTGEQKALLIGLVLAHAAEVATRAEAPLILLLDEVAAHLDEQRRESLAQIVEALDCQAFMTGTDRSLFEAFGTAAEHLTAAGGKIDPAS